MFDIAVSSSREVAALEYSFLRIRDDWPRAVVCRADAPFTELGLIGLISSGVRRCLVFRDRDAYLSYRLFLCQGIPRVDISITTGTLHIEGEGDALPLVHALVEMPFWVQRVTDSQRLRATKCSDSA